MLPLSSKGQFHMISHRAKLSIIGILTSALAYATPCNTPACSLDTPVTTASTTITPSSFVSSFCGGVSCMTLGARVSGMNSASGVNVTLFTVAGFSVQQLTGQPNTYYFAAPDTIPSGTGNCSVHATFPSDIQFKVTRDVANSIDRFEIWDSLGRTLLGTCNYVVSVFASDATLRSSGINIGSAGAASTGGSIAYFRWDKQITAAGVAPPINLSGTPQWLDYEWSPSPGNATDTSATGGQNLSGSFTYSNTPDTLSCNIVPQTPLFSGANNSVHGFGGIKAGSSFIITAAGASGIGAITHAWTMTASPMGAPAISFNSTSIVNPTISNLLNFGEYDVQDVLTDSIMSLTCPFKIGVVYTLPGTDIINFSTETGDSVYGGKLTKILGMNVGQSRFGASPLPWEDDRQQYIADLQILNRQTYYAGFWKTPQTGTITITGGGTTIALSGGVGFQDASGPCPSGSTPRSGAFIWWNYTGRDSRSDHFTQRGISSCPTNVSATIVEAYPSNATITAGSYTLALCDSGCGMLTWGFGYDGDGAPTGYSSTWNYAPAPANYYDNATGYYSLYYRTGLTDYLTAARSYADDWWSSPALDQGNSCHFGGAWQICYNSAGQSFSMQGVILRGLDGRSDIFPAMRISMWPTFMLYSNTLLAANGYIFDTRVQAYMQDYAAECAVAETDSTTASACRTSLVASLPTWQGYRDATGGWPSWYSNGGSIGNSSSVTISGGSPTTATITNGTCPAGTWYLWMWPANPSTMPANVGAGDSRYYTATCINTATMTLSPAYSGTFGSGKGWAIGVPQVGWGCQTFMCGLLGHAFAMSAYALDGFDNTSRNAYYAMVDQMTAWQLSYAVTPQTVGGLVTFYSSTCGAPPVPLTDPMCYPSGELAQNKRSLSAEIIWPLADTYRRRPTNSLKNSINSLISDMFSKPSTNSLLGSTLDYLTGLNNDCVDPRFGMVNFYACGTPPSGKSAKWNGQFFGFPSAHAWFSVLSVTTIPGAATGNGLFGGLTQ